EMYRYASATGARKVCALAHENHRVGSSLILLVGIGGVRHVIVLVLHIVQIVINDLPGDRAGNTTTATAVLHDDGHGDLRILDGCEGDEQRVFTESVWNGGQIRGDLVLRQAGDLGTTGFSGNHMIGGAAHITVTGPPRRVDDAFHGIDDDVPMTLVFQLDRR